MAIKTKWVTEDCFSNEDQLSAAIFRHFDKEYPELRGLYVLNFNNPKDAKQGNALLGQGLRAGHPDASVFLPIFKCSIAGLFLEYKMSKTGITSPKQKVQHKRLKSVGYVVVIITSLEQFKFVIDSYIKKYHQNL